MTAESTTADVCAARETRPRRSWRQFSLRTLLLLMLVLSVCFALFAFRLQRARRQAAAVATIRKLGGGTSPMTTSRTRQLAIKRLRPNRQCPRGSLGDWVQIFFMKSYRRRSMENSPNRTTTCGPFGRPSANCAKWSCFRRAGNGSTAAWLPKRLVSTVD